MIDTKTVWQRRETMQVTKKESESDRKGGEWDSESESMVARLG